VNDLQLGNAKTAFAILEPLFREHPNHPGIAHYIIHACDHPQMAQEGLSAARKYAQTAPQVPHALHMPAHIFARLGLWRDDIQSNLASKSAAEAGGLHHGAENYLHAMEFLEYAYLQTGRFDEAKAIVEEAKTVQPTDVDPRYPDMWASVEARYPALLAIETKDWAMGEHLNPVPGGPTTQEAILLAHAEAAAHLRNRELADATLKQLEPLTPAQSERTESPGRIEIRAWVDFTRGEPTEAVALLESLAERQDRTGKSEVEIPAREMLADMLLLSGRPIKALTQYEQSLRTDPNRFNALFGAGQAAKQSGRKDVAAKYYRMLLVNCPQADGAAIEKLHQAKNSTGYQATTATGGS
jgi:tetratricopeptide (TPR) repeat protein